MIKRCGLIVKPAHLPLAHFRAYWLDHHTTLVRESKGLLRYRVNIIDRQEFPDAGIDGFSELWFDTAENMAAAFRPQTPAKDDEVNFAASVTVVIVEEHAIVG